jgi:hypothetical protein
MAETWVPILDEVKGGKHKCQQVNGSSRSHPFLR